MADAVASTNEQAAPGSTPDAGAAVHTWVHTWVTPGLSGSVTVPAIEAAVPSCPAYGPPASTTGAASMITRTTAVAEPPSSSRTVTSTLWVPGAVKGWLDVQVPLPGVSVTSPLASGVPSS